MKKVVAVVPIKLNSARLPGKNIKTFTNGKPLCWYILSTLLSIREIKDVYVYCSDQKIKEYIPAEVKFLERSRELDLDTTKINEVLRAFVSDVPADIYVMSHTTAPFIKRESIEKGLKKVLSGDYDSAFAARCVQEFLWMGGKPFNYDLENIPRTQDLPVIMQETSGFYIYGKSVMQERGRRIGLKPYIVEIGEIEGVDIDNEEDFIIADALYNYRSVFNKDGKGVDYE